MIKGVGVDLVEIGRIKTAVKNIGDRFLKRIYSDFELAYCTRRKALRFPELAVRFAAKEAYGKALGTGIKGHHWNEIEVRNDPKGKPLIYYKGKLQPKVQVSLSHDGNLAIAFLIIEE
ncbi:MAG: holo-ACP synthase [Candidatus Margulisbacteria bacterium]|nr:holo-ACP synthase [Candidatus Margulisiibacteriota bacterium]MBU1022557.1 holo-ACP synthase [Candidatus Margulisiibacteriota bacterium]MBU1728843.1 holo-ACP synthase [Candidatus Margulisiibacteriota bacterium]MBU1955474.1 holo-ACP synthase [Candidatus Margulisiibacteriota bacterium]